MEDLNKKSKSELEKERGDHQIALRGIRFNASGGKSKNVKETKNLKKEIARINTVIKTK